MKALAIKFTTDCNELIMDVIKDESTSPNYTNILFEIVALTLRYLRGNASLVQQFENLISSSLNEII